MLVSFWSAPLQYPLDEEGKPRIISVNLKKIVKGARLDKNLYVQSGDIVYVPKRFLATTTEVLSELVTSMQFLVFTQSLLNTIEQFSK